MATSKRVRLRPGATQAIQRLKEELAARILAAVDRQGLTVREAQSRTGQAAGDFSRLRGGQLDRFTIERLLVIAEALGERLSMVVTTEGGQGGPALPAPLADHLRGLRILCRRHRVRRLGAFGAILRAGLDPKCGEIDLAVEFWGHRPFGAEEQYARFNAALGRLLRRDVGLVHLNALPDSLFKRSIERSQVLVYGPK